MKASNQSWEYYDFESYTTLFFETVAQEREIRAEQEDYRRERVGLAGEQGWELVSIVAYVSGEPYSTNHKLIERFYFKRPLDGETHVYKVRD